MLSVLHTEVGTCVEAGCATGIISINALLVQELEEGGLSPKPEDKTTLQKSLAGMLESGRALTAIHEAN